MIYVFYILAAVLVWFSYKSVRGGAAYLNYFKQELAKPQSIYTPFATIIAPYKGLDEGHEANILALLEQDYPNFEIIFVVDDERDPAVSIIEELLSYPDAETERSVLQDRQDEQDSSEMKNVANHPENPVYPVNFSSPSPRLGSKLIMAPKATNSSQKVENLREAVLHADSKSEAFVFVDSDARPNKDWLRLLVGPLADEEVGASTGYRWFIANTPTFASELRGVWNASIASSLGPNTKSNFCWGGSMAIRRYVFERLQIREKWRGTLSDDFTLTRVMNAAALKIHFVPQAVTLSIGACTFHELFEFTTRQMKITRVYARQLWLLSFVGSALFCGVMISAFAIAVFSRQNTAAVWVSLLVLSIVSVFSIGKSTFRLWAVSLVLDKYTPELNRQFFAHNVLWLLAPVLFLANCGTALFSRTINWRGTVYEMVSPEKTNIIEKRKIGS